jgi:conjugal transfer mating pair stabilization protein TraG
VINLYLHMTIAGDLDALQSAGNLTLPSILSLYKLDFLLQDYLATGGMLAASTPAISLMLIYGSAITATHLAGRLQGGDHIDERITSPDVMRPAPALTMSPLMEHAPLRGTTTTGADHVLWRADVGQSVSRELSSTRRSAEEAVQSFTRELASAASLSAARRGESFDARAMGWSYESSGSQTDRVIAQEGEALARRYEQTGTSSDRFSAAITAGLGALGARRSRDEVKGTIRDALIKGGGTLTGTHQVDNGLIDQIADDIARRLTTDQELSSRIAEGVKQDLQVGQRNVFTDGLSREEQSRLGARAAEAVSATRSLERSESLAERFGTLGSYRAVEIGHAVAANPNLREQLYDRIDRLGLTGDHQRLAGSWSYAQVFADREQARAAAGMALLLGYGEGERQLTADEQQGAREAGLGILADAFGSPKAAGIVPQRNTDVEASAPSPGGVRAAFEAGTMYDPAPSVAGLAEEIRAHQGRTASTVTDPAPVLEQRERDFGGIERAAETHRQDLRGEKGAMYAERIRERALLPRSLAQITAETMGGLATKLRESGALATSGAAGALDQFIDTLAGGGNVEQAVQAAGEGWAAVRQEMIDTRLAHVAGIGLTSAQMGVYAAALDRILLFPGGLEKALGSEYEQAREALAREEGPLGPPMADLLERAASSTQDTDLRLIAAYNRANAGGAPLSPPLSQTSVTGGSQGALLDLIAAPESGGNYNAWYGQPRQSEVDLSSLTLDQVRTLQGELVRANGGSAIGRYQIVGETLDHLMGRLNLSGAERFTPELQDRLALQLARDAGLDDWREGRTSDEGFAQSLARVWAGLPRDRSNRSYYEGVAGNRAGLDYDTVVASLQAMRREGS